jgi:hypothetical protein
MLDTATVPTYLCGVKTKGHMKKLWQTLLVLGVLVLIVAMARAEDKGFGTFTNFGGITEARVADSDQQFFKAREFSLSAFYQSTTTDFDNERGATGIAVGYYLTENIGFDVSSAFEDMRGSFVDDLTVRGLYRIPIRRHAFYFFGGGTRHLREGTWGIVLGPGAEVRLNQNFGLFSEIALTKELTGAREVAAQARLGLRVSF